MSKDPFKEVRRALLYNGEGLRRVQEAMDRGLRVEAVEMDDEEDVIEAVEMGDEEDVVEGEFVVVDVEGTKAPEPTFRQRRGKGGFIAIGVDRGSVSGSEGVSYWWDEEGRLKLFGAGPE